MEMIGYNCSNCGELPHWAACVEAGRRLRSELFGSHRSGEFRALVVKLSPSYCPAVVLRRLSDETGVSVSKLASLVSFV
jgi:hypothetical protein